MKKILILLILSVILLTSVVACKKEDTPYIKPPISEDSGNDTKDSDSQDDTYEPQPPIDQFIEDIKEAWYDLCGSYVEWKPEKNLFDGIGYYYGTYRSGIRQYVIIMSYGIVDGEYSLKIGNETFSSNCDFKLYAFDTYDYKNKFKSLKQAYENGYLTDSDIAAIAEYHRSIKEPMYLEGRSSCIDEDLIISEGWSRKEEESQVYDKWNKIIHGAESIKYIKLDGETTGRPTRIYTDEKTITELLSCLEESSPKIIFEFDEFDMLFEQPGVEFYEHYASIMFVFGDNTALRISICKNGRIIFNSDAVTPKYQFMYYSDPNTVNLSEIAKILNYN